MENTRLPIRILPMDCKGEFTECHSIKELQENFFLRVFPRRTDGEYRYHESGLQATTGTIVLFQSGGAIVASATLNDVRRFGEPDNAHYNGALYFDVSSIRIFEPVTLAAVQNIWPKIKRLGHVKWKLNPDGYVAFARELKGIKTPAM